ncbi:CheR family methyltransferase [Indiicoccus explosivorum]|uniref:CheR family methyltransferase n=1 Tax=Indiicoccus explosivorum TaxID=1917864 RepID=UPI000B44EA64|nr:protein-glutamate O-methyltransferase CheR [Indiicoccus explosivorum]
MQDYSAFIKNIHTTTGIDLALYKEAQMKRRLVSLYTKKGYGSFADYFTALKGNRELMNEFLDRMTINVSEFYRNSKRWEVLENKIFPKLLDGRDRLKIWSAACSTGEEPYSIAMVLSSHIPLPEIRIKATDLDETVLQKARLAVYPERSIAEVPKQVLGRYFEQQGTYWKVAEEVKRTVAFSRHNLLKDDYGTGFDLIVCRNVMIYFTEEAKDMIYKKFSSALRPGGILFVGSTEQIFNPSAYGFETEEMFFYRKT